MKNNWLYTYVIKKTELIGPFLELVIQEIC